MILNRENLASLAAPNLQVPQGDFTRLPEKVLQFGTGVLLRGLPDYFISKANQQGIFNGRIVVVKSTDKGGTEEFDQQDNLYTICVRGIEEGQKVEENIICSAISRVLTAGNSWAEILAVGVSPDLEVVISNTTEVGIQLVPDDISAQPPVSYPGKLLAILVARFKAFNGDISKGLVIVPTELIPDNGTKLKNIVLELAAQNMVAPEILVWLAEANIFCNSLVDRIVPGKPDAQTLAKLETELGYKDDLLTMSEVYRLWAIEGNARVQELLSFAKADTGVVITEDIDLHRELKLRLLNGTHTLSCGVAFLAGFPTVKSAMDNEAMVAFISNLMQEEIAPAIPYAPAIPEAAAFSRKVLDRFRNPHIEHLWHSISMNFTTKLGMRVIPALRQYYIVFNQAPEYIATGFAAYLRFMKVTSEEKGKFYGSLNGSDYLINDDKAVYFQQVWDQQDSLASVVSLVLQNQEFWGIDLTTLPGFATAVLKKLEEIEANGVLATISKLESKE